jgi:hypothetical protein
LEEAFEGLGRGFSRSWRRLSKALEEAFKGLERGF